MLFGVRSATDKFWTDDPSTQKPDARIIICCLFLSYLIALGRRRLILLLQEILPVIPAIIYNDAGGTTESRARRPL